MGDVAHVSIGKVPRQGVAGQNENDDIVYGMVLMRKGENATVVLDAVKTKLDEIRATSLPPGVTIEPFYDRSWLIQKTMKTVFSNLVEGAMLVCFVLFIFLGNFRAAAIVALVIPLSLLGTFIGLTIVGIPANLLSLGAMDFGIIVDGAVIVVENVFHRLSTYEGKLEGAIVYTRSSMLPPKSGDPRCSRWLSSSPRTFPSSHCNATRDASSRPWPGR